MDEYFVLCSMNIFHIIKLTHQMSATLIQSFNEKMMKLHHWPRMFMLSYCDEEVVHKCWMHNFIYHHTVHN